jgi:hypothetical protein
MMLILCWCSLGCSLVACILALGACLGCSRLAAIYDTQMALCAAAQANSPFRAAHAHKEGVDVI